MPIDPLKPSSSRTVTTTNGQPSSPSTNPRPATTHTVRTPTVNPARSDFEPSRPNGMQLNPQRDLIDPSAYRSGMRSGPVTDPTIGHPGGRGAGGAAHRAYGPLQGPVLPYTASQQDAIAAARRGDYGPEARAIAERYLTDPYPASIERSVLPDVLRHASTMSAADRSAMLGAAMREPDSAQALTQLFGTTAYRTLPAEQQQQVRDIVNRAGFDGLRQLADILFRDPRRLQDPVPAPNSGTTLSELARLANTPLHPSFTRAGVTTAAALDSLLMDVANPRDIFQGSSGTCTVTSMQYDVVSTNPAEYARIIADLATAGHSTLRGDSDGDGARDVLYAQTEYLVPSREGDRRRLSEVWFQSAAMELANGALDYNARYDVNVNNRPETTDQLSAYGTHPGLYGMQQQRMLEALFDVDYTMYNAADPAVLVSTLRNHPRGAERFPIILNLRFDSSPETGGTQGPVTDPTIGDGGNHAVTFSHTARVGGQERIYFRDPWANGEPMAPAQWDARSGMYFMDAQTFGERVDAVHIAVPTLNGEAPAQRYSALDPDAQLRNPVTRQVV